MQRCSRAAGPGHATRLSLRLVAAVGGCVCMVRVRPAVGEQAACVTCPSATTVRAFAEQFTVDLVHPATPAPQASDSPHATDGQAAVAHGLWPLIRQVRSAAFRGDRARPSSK